MHLHSERMFVLYQSCLPLEVIYKIDYEIKNDAAITIAKHWYKSINNLFTALGQTSIRQETDPLVQEDINLIFALKKAMKNNYIRLDNIFWSKIINKIYYRLVSTKTVIIDNRKYTNMENNNIIYYYSILVYTLYKKILLD